MDYTITEVRNVLRNYEGVVMRKKGDSKQAVSKQNSNSDSAHISAEAFGRLLASELSKKIP
jgi:hypothetical protein